ncbi:MAG: PrgI family protein [Clostridia bacterium]|nr:PrgI family protein [Clostridia bacterium]
MLETRIPKEITDYREKLLLGLTTRQLVCVVIAVVMLALSYVIFVVWFKWTVDDAGYPMMILAAPALACGFVRKNDMTIDKYLALLFKHYTGNHKYTYKTEPTIDLLNDKTETEGKYDWIRNTSKERKDGSDSGKAETFCFDPADQKARTRKLEIARRKVAEAEQAYREAQRRI